MGKNVAEAMKMPIEDVKWKGDDMGVCPVCHCNLLLITNHKNPVECPVCGIAGKLKMDGDKIKVTFSKKERARSRLTLAGKLEHQIEIQDVMKELEPGLPEVPEKLKKYKAYLTPLKPPKKAKKKANKKTAKK